MSQPPRRLVRATTITADAGGRIVDRDVRSIVGPDVGRIVLDAGRIVGPDAGGRIVGPLSGLRHAREPVLRRDGRFLAAGADAASGPGRIVCPFGSGGILRPHVAAAR